MKTINELKKEVLEAAGYCDVTEEMIRSKEEDSTLGEVKGRDGKDYIWYLDGDGCEACMCVETEELVSEDVIFEQLACPDSADIAKAKRIIKETQERSLELFSKLECEVLDPDMCCLDFDTRTKVEEICQCVFRVYSLASEFFDEKGEC